MSSRRRMTSASSPSPSADSASAEQSVGGWFALDFAIGCARRLERGRGEIVRSARVAELAPDQGQRVQRPWVVVGGVEAPRVLDELVGPRERGAEPAQVGVDDGAEHSGVEHALSTPA